MSFFYNYKSVIEGIFDIQVGEKSYWVVLKDRKTISLTNFGNSLDTFDLKLGYTLNTISTWKNCIYGIDSNYKYVYRYKCLPGLTFKIDTLKMPQINIESFFISSNIHTPIEILDSFSLLVPYRIENAKNKNLVDTCAYLLLTPDDKNELQYKKMIPYPTEYLRQYEYLRNPVLAVDRTSKKIFYTFESYPQIYSCDFDGNQIKTATIKDFKHSDIDVDSITNFGYLLSYSKKSDATKKIFCSENQGIYVVKQNGDNAGIQNSYTIYFYNTSLERVWDIRLGKELNTEISYLRDNKIYVYESQSNTDFISISFVGKL